MAQLGQGRRRAGRSPPPCPPIRYLRLARRRVTPPLPAPVTGPRRWRRRRRLRPAAPALPSASPAGARPPSLWRAGRGREGAVGSAAHCACAESCSWTGGGARAGAGPDGTEGRGQVAEGRGCGAEVRGRTRSWTWFGVVGLNPPPSGVCAQTHRFRCPVCEGKRDIIHFLQLLLQGGSVFPQHLQCPADVLNANL